MKLQLTAERRRGKIAIWIEGGHSRLNIWDLPEKMLTEEVWNALASAVERGIIIQQEATRKQLNEFINIQIEPKVQNHEQVG